MRMRRIRRPEKKTVIIAVSVAAAAVLLGALYFWYTGTYGGAKKFKMEKPQSPSYEYLSLAAEYNLTEDYLWARTKKLMIENTSDGTLIPSDYMIAGRLSTQPAEESGEFLLSDQALLLDMYVRRSDRFAARDLVKKVKSEDLIEKSDTTGRIVWLSAFCYYYSNYGSSDDYEQIKSLTGEIFDKDGTVKPHKITVAYYEGSSYSSLADGSEQLPENPDGAPLEDITSEENIKSREIEGVMLSEIDLFLIKTLEDNKLLPEGSLEKNLEIINGGIASEDIPIYAFAYSKGENGIDYCYQKDIAATLSVSSSIRTMRNLAKVGKLPDVQYSWLKNLMFNESSVRERYYITTGRCDGDESFDSYADIMAISLYKDDRDLFEKAVSRIGSRVATYTDSPALSMIYREKGGRYVFDAGENLDICFLLF